MSAAELNSTQAPLQKIAMIDDHNLLRNGLANIINAFDGFRVTLQASNGREFIENWTAMRYLTLCCWIST